MYIDFEAIFYEFAPDLRGSVFGYTRNHIATRAHFRFPQSAEIWQRKKVVSDLLRAKVKDGAIRVVDAVLPTSMIVGERPIFTWPEDAALVTTADGSLCFDPVIERHRQRLPKPIESRETRLYLASAAIGEALGGLPAPEDLQRLHALVDAELEKPEHGLDSFLVGQVNLSQVYVQLRDAHLSSLPCAWMRMLDTEPPFPLAMRDGTFILFGGSVDRGFAEHVHPALLRGLGLKLTRPQRYEVW